MRKDFVTILIIVLVGCGSFWSGHLHRETQSKAEAVEQGRGNYALNERTGVIEFHYKVPVTTPTPVATSTPFVNVTPNPNIVPQ